MIFFFTAETFVHWKINKQGGEINENNTVKTGLMLAQTCNGLSLHNFPKQCRTILFEQVTSLRNHLVANFIKSIKRWSGLMVA